MLTLLLSLAVMSPAHAGLDREPTLDFATTYKYAGADQKQQDLDMDQIVQAILKDPSGTHYVWQPGWSSWKSWSEVPELKAAVDAATAADPVFSYSTGGAVEQLAASEIAKRIAANPSANHLAWKPGMAAWLPAVEVPEVAAAMKASAAPPPTPDAEKAPKEEKAPRTEEAPATEAPAMEAAADTKSGASCGMCSAVRIGGEVRAFVPWAYRYVNILGEEVPSDPIGAEVGRARITASTDLGQYASAVVAVQAAQVDDSSATDVGLGGVADGWAFSAPLAYADIHYGEKVKLGGRIGSQGVAFGTNLYFQDYDNYYIGARVANQSLAQKYGVLPEYDAGLGLYVGDADELWTVDVQMLNGSGLYQTDDNFGRAIVGRAGFHPGAFANDAVEINAWASGFYQVKAVDNSQIALGFDGAAELRFRRYFRVLAEVMYGGEGDKNGTGYNGIGYQIAGAGALPFEKGPMDRVEVVVADQSYNPQIGGAPVGAYDLSVGLNAYWNTEGHGTVLTGFAYEMYIPISEAEDVLHTGVFQVAAKF